MDVLEFVLDIATVNAQAVALLTVVDVETLVEQRAQDVLDALTVVLVMGHAKVVVVPNVMAVVIAVVQSAQDVPDALVVVHVILRARRDAIQDVRLVPDVRQHVMTHALLVAKPHVALHVIQIVLELVTVRLHLLNN